MSIEKEKTLLKYLSVLNTYDLSMTPVPVSAFDLLMDETSFAPIPKQPKRNQRQRQASKEGPKKKKRLWENRLSNESKILLNMSSRQAMGNIQTLSIIHPMLSKEILQVLSITKDGKKQVLSEVALELFAEPFLQINWSIANENLLKIIKNIVQHRNRLPDGRPETRFAPFIQEIIDSESTEKAANVLVRGYGLIPDPFVAQQVARLYIYAQNWHKATEYAEKATSMNPNNSYLWDTRGQIFRARITELYKEFSTKSEVHYEDGLKAIQIATKAIEMFEKSTVVADMEMHKENYNSAGFYGQVDVIVRLLDCLSYLPCFRDDTDLLHRLLVEPSFAKEDLPREIQIWDDVDGEKYIAKLQELQQKTVEVVARIEDETIQLRQDYLDDYSRNQIKFQFEQLIKIKESIDSYYGEDSDEVPANLSNEEKIMFRGRRIRRLGGRSIMRIFQMRRDGDTGHELMQIMKLADANMKSGIVNAEDLQTMISVSLALAVSAPKHLEHIKYEDMVQWSRQLFELRSTLRVQALEPYLFYVMFNWPRQSTKEHANPKQIKDAIRHWRDAFFNKYRHQVHHTDEGKQYRKKDTTIFFLANGSGMAAISDYEDLKRQIGDGISRERFWVNPTVLRELQRHSGILCDDGNMVLVDLIYADGHKDKLEIQTSFPIRKRAWWNKRVYFVIGFSRQGPKAFDIKQEDPTLTANMAKGHKVPSKPKPQQSAGHAAAYIPSHEQDLLTQKNFQKRKKQLEDKLAAIRTLRATLKREKRRPNHKEVRQNNMDGLATLRVPLSIPSGIRPLQVFSVFRFSYLLGFN